MDRHLSKRTFGTTLGILVLGYLLTRLPALTKSPLFVDEITHILRAKFSPLDGFRAGKHFTVLFSAVFIRGVPAYPVWMARFTSVLLGVMTLLLLAYAGQAIYTKRDGLLASLIYLIIPYAYFFDRLALTDNMVVVIGVMITIATYQIIQNPGPYKLPLLTLLLIIGILAKLTGALMILVPVAGVITLSPPREWRKTTLRILPALLGAGVILVALLVVGYGGNQGAKITNNLGFFPLIQRNIARVTEWWIFFLTPPWIVLTFIAAGWAAFISRKREDFYLLALLGLFTMPFILKARTLLPRYMFMVLIPITLLTGRFLGVWGQRIWGYIRKAKRSQAALVGMLCGIIVVLLIGMPISTNLAIARHPLDVAYPEVVQWQYISNWPAGTGLNELADFLQSEALTAPDGINVVRFSGQATPLTGGLELLLPSTGRVYTHYLDPTTAEESITLLHNLSADRRTVLVLNPPAEEIWLPEDYAFDKVIAELDGMIWEYIKPGGESRFQVWEVQAQTH